VTRHGRDGATGGPSKAHSTATQRESATDAAGPLVWLSHAMREALVKEATRAFPLETGGVLMGYADTSDTELVVKAVVGPGPRAVHRRASFVPDHAFHDAAVARHYRESQRRWTYLGDWHSHPAGECSLSRTDRHTLARIAGAPCARVPRPLMLVLAGGHGLADDSRQIGGIDSPPHARGQLTRPWQLGCWRRVKHPTHWWTFWRDDGIARCRCQIFDEQA
jgi:integrative and conjugative element protein (TIGR02256 family)